MAKPNYNYEKRQRELKKAKKQEEKRLKKQQRTDDIVPSDAEPDASTAE